MLSLHKLLMAFALICFTTSAMADDVRCTVTLVACGEVAAKLTPLTTIKAGLCLEADLADVGKAPADPLKLSSTLFIGIELKADKLILAGGSAKSGMVLQCKWSVKDPKPEEKIASLKKALPTLLQGADPKLKVAFPSVKTLDPSKLKEMVPADSECLVGIKEFCKAK